MRSIARVMAFLGLIAVQLTLAGGETPEALTIFLDLVVKDLRGQPVLHLQPDEIILLHDGVRQRIASLRAQAQPGSYELSYVPKSGKPGAVALQVLRAGARPRGLDGGALKPRVVQPLVALEAELARLLETEPAANSFPIRAQAQRFEEGPDGTHYALAVEVPLAQAATVQQGGQWFAKTQFFARVKDSAGRAVQTFHTEHSLPFTSEQQLRAQRLLWTGQVHLRAGHYSFESIVRDALNRTSVRTVSVEVPASTAGPRVSSVTLLGSEECRRITHANENEDPFYAGGRPLMPALQLETYATPSAKVQFLVVVYADPALADPITARAELLRKGEVVGTAPLDLPLAAERGGRPYVGSLGLQQLPPAEYQLRVVAQQGPAVVQEQAPFTITAAPPPTLDLRAADDETPAPPALQGESPELRDITLLLRQRRFDEAIEKLNRLARPGDKPKADVLLALSEAYLRIGAYADAEKAARRAAESTQQQAALLEAHVLLGRALADGERNKFDARSQRLRAAEAAFRKALEISQGRSPDLQMHLATVLVRLERTDEARAVLSALLAAPDVTDSAAAEARQLLQSPRCAVEACLPDFSFVSAEGERHSSSELHGKVVLLSFWATWCRPCVAAMPEVRKLHARYAKEPFVLIGVNLDSDPKDARDFIAQQNMVWPEVMQERARQLERLLAPRGIPSEYLFSHEGLAIGKTTGWGTTTSTILNASIRDAVKKAKKALEATPEAKSQ